MMTEDTIERTGARYRGPWNRRGTLWIWVQQARNSAGCISYATTRPVAPEESTWLQTGLNDTSKTASDAGWWSV
jgi:hypothetical protein